jgi:hypothetical protein
MHAVRTDDSRCALVLCTLTVRAIMQARTGRRGAGGQLRQCKSKLQH